MVLTRHWPTGLFVSLFFFLALAHSAAACGNIYHRVDYGDGPQERVNPIVDCDNPFNADTPAPFTATVTLAEQIVTEDSVITVVEDSPVTISYAVENNDMYPVSTLTIFRREAEDYRLLVESFNEDVTEIPSISAGEYVAVVTYQTLAVSEAIEPLWKRFLKTLFLPASAIAFYEDYLEVVAVPFTVAYETVAPEGASSVLFLPGIQASRLYTAGVLGTENQLWEPNINADVEKLAMSEAGESMNDVYTRDVVDEVNVLPVAQGNVYKGFLNMLSDMKDEGMIADFNAFAYDWRYDVFTVATEPVKYQDEEKILLDEVKKLASESYTGKVTIVAHSNGGLVTKALLHEYGNTELAGLVDKIVMVGTPQLGTPKAIGSVLHGLEQNTPFRIIINESTARETTRNMPGAYGLLPSPKYFAEADEVIIEYDGSAIALPVATYGDFSDYDNFADFLTDDKGIRNEVVTISQPITLNAQLLERNHHNQQLLDSWTAPDDVAVYEAAGTGLPTMSGFYYREFSCKENPHCILIPFLKPVPRFTIEGDETVVLKSALAYEGDGSKFVVNLPSETIFSPNKHANLTESESVQDFIESVILYPYLTDTIVSNEFSSISSRYTIIGVHSPVSILVRNSSGEEVGRVNGEITENIAGASYFEFAGSKYVIVPDEEVISVLLHGEAAGRYSLTIEELTETGEQIKRQEIIGATSTPEMIAEFVCTDGVCGEVVVDYDADGAPDVQFDWLGTYEKLQQDTTMVEEPVNKSERTQSSGTRVNSRLQPSGLVAGVTTTNQDEELAALWNILLQVQVIIDELKIYYNLHKYAY